MRQLVVDPADCAVAYRGVRQRVSQLVHDADASAIEAIAPATPEWRVHDILAHLSGINTDILNGVLEGVGTDAWTAAQVETRRDWTLDAILDEWETNGTAVEAMAPALGPAVGQWVYDACTHEHDIRDALRAPGARDSDAVTIAYLWGTERLGEVLDASEASALRFRTELGERCVGTVMPATALRLSCFEMTRAMTGRRSLAQMAAYEWEGTPAPASLGLFPPRNDDFVE